MTLIERILGKSEPEPEPNKMNEKNERIIGKIIKLDMDGGWGFISSKEISFTRIFFHWTGLNQDTLHFTKLERGMQVEFEVLEVENKGLRAIKIKVLEDVNS